MSDPVREAADAVLEALERVEIVAQASDMEDLDTARHDLRAALAADREPEPVQITDEMVEREDVQEALDAVDKHAERDLDHELHAIVQHYRGALLAAALSDPPPEGEKP